MCSPLNLTATLFGETANEKYSQVVVLIRANSTYERFENFKHAQACFPEFSGIGKLIFKYICTVSHTHTQLINE